jgi:hypothetical protein
MLELLPYFYYSKNDSTKEAIDKVLSATKEGAIAYFSRRKNIGQADFLILYIVEVYEETKSE